MNVRQIPWLGRVYAKPYDGVVWKLQLLLGSLIQVLYLINVLVEGDSEWDIDVIPLIFIIQLYHFHFLELIVLFLFRPLLRYLVMYWLKKPGLLLD